MRVSVKHPRYTEHVYTVAAVDIVSGDKLVVRLDDGRTMAIDIRDATGRIEA